MVDKIRKSSPGIYIKKAGTTYRFSTRFSTSYAARDDAKLWQSLGHKTLIIKHEDRFGVAYDVYYSIKKSEHSTSVSRRKSGPFKIGYRETKKKERGLKNPFRNLL